MHNDILDLSDPRQLPAFCCVVEIPWTYLLSFGFMKIKDLLNVLLSSQFDGIYA